MYVNNNPEFYGIESKDMKEGQEIIMELVLTKSDISALNVCQENEYWEIDEWSNTPIETLVAEALDLS